MVDLEQYCYKLEEFEFTYLYILIYLKYENNIFTALENGKTTVIFTLIDDDKCSITLDVTVY